MRQPDLRYGTAEWQVATDLAHRMRDGGRVRQIIKAVAAKPSRLRVLRAVQQLPVCHIDMNRVEATALKEVCFPPASGLPVFGGRRAQALLTLPSEEALYLAGGRKQALRTNISRARRLGVTCERVPTVDAWLECARHVLAHRRGGPEVMDEIDPPLWWDHAAYYVARNVLGTPVAYAAVALFGECGVLFCLLRDPTDPASSDARYLLHTYLALDLGQSGLTYLLVGSALRESDGHQYFQHLLGYEPENLRIHAH